MWKFCSIDRHEANVLRKNLKNAEKMLKEKQATLNQKLDKEEYKARVEKERKENEIRKLLHLFSGRIY
jgi:hypothetical protein